MKHVLIALLFGMASSAALAAEEDSAKPVTAAQAFVTKATQDGMTEVQLGKLAQSRSSDPKVKAFAARMVTDHTKADAELGTLAKQKHLEVPDQLDDEHATIVHAVGSKPPSEFDAEYGKHMVEAHDKAVTLFTDAEALGDRELAGFAKKTLPKLHEHKQLAEALPSKPRSPASAGSASAAEQDISPGDDAGAAPTR